MNGLGKNLILWAIIAVVLLAVFSNFGSDKKGAAGLQMQEQLVSAYEMTSKSGVSPSIDAVISQSTGSNPVYYLVDPAKNMYAFAVKNGNIYTVSISSAEAAPDILRDLSESGVSYHTVAINPKEQGVLSMVLWTFGPILLLVGVWIFFMRRMSGGGGGGPGSAMQFGKSKAKMLGEDQINVTFADVAGCEEAKEDAVEMVDFLKDPAKYARGGAKMPTGALMVGPPGTGKTLMAKAIAGEAKVPFFSISGSDFVEMFVGVGASRVRDMFDTAKKHAPCIIFIDEIDAVGRARGAGLGGGHDEREQTLNQLLVEMDGFEGSEGIVVIAATNRPDVLDKALLRPGRFDRQLVVGLPDVHGREQILRVHMKKIHLKDSVDKIAPRIARGTPGFSGADLANMVNEAAIFTVRDNREDGTTLNDFERAKDKIMMGAERRSMKMSEAEREMTAYHEAGHAIIGYVLNKQTKEENARRKAHNKAITSRRDKLPMQQGHSPVYKVSIMPRGQALGVTMFIPEEEMFSQSKKFLVEYMAGLYGGRIAEEVIFGNENVSTGASNDIERVTDIAKGMVKKWGLTLGKTKDGRKTAPRLYEKDNGGNVFLGQQMGEHEHVSGETVHELDSRIGDTLLASYEMAEKILRANLDKMDAMADALMKYETIDIDMIDEIMSGIPFEQLSAPEWWTADDENVWQDAQKSAATVASDTNQTDDSSDD